MPHPSSVYDHQSHLVGGVCFTGGRLLVGCCNFVFLTLGGFGQIVLDGITRLPKMEMILEC